LRTIGRSGLLGSRKGLLVQSIDVGVPSASMRVFVGARGGLASVENSNISLRGLETE
jgi:hypothetical protein